MRVEKTVVFGVAIAMAFSVLARKAGCEPPYPPSSIVQSATFDSTPTIIRRAVGSDNWPITWCDDDSLFTSYGDGSGFEPRLKEKLSQGFARITGMPPAFEAVNIRSPSGETQGDGPKGAKASGMLMVDGRLYMWVRNTGNSQLVWSKDRGATWTWGFKFTESFGCPAFLNYGKNYEGARDSFVYTYSSDGPSAYVSYDTVVLARVPKDKITQRAAYEFFAGEKGGEAVWSNDIAARQAIFRYPGNCQRLDVIYHPVFRRYWLILGYNHESGWGIYDAPKPWGPWTTVFHTDRWDIRGTHGYRFPTKWISGDGKTLWLIFSGGVKYGYDAFCLRRLTLTTASGATQ